MAGIFAVVFGVATGKTFGNVAGFCRNTVEMEGDEVNAGTDIVSAKSADEFRPRWRSIQIQSEHIQVPGVLDFGGISGI